MNNSGLSKNKGKTVEDYEKHFRKEHAIASAVHAVKDKEFIKARGINANKVALGCLLHSKNRSGVKNLADEEQWKEAVEYIESFVESYNMATGESLKFDSSFLLNKNGDFNKKELSEMRSMVIALRIGDANGHDYRSVTTQAGEKIEIEYLKETDTEKIKNMSIESGKKEYYYEVQDTRVVIGGEVLNDENDPDGISRMFALGEGNFKSLSMETRMINGEMCVCEVFEILNANVAPYSTMKCIEERLMEIETAKLEKNITKEENKKIEKVSCISVIELNDNTKENIVKEYKKYMKDLEDNYNMNIEVLK